MNKMPETSKAAAEKLVQNIRRKTRQTYSAEAKIRIVLTDLRKKFLEAGKPRRNQTKGCLNQHLGRNRTRPVQSYAKGR